MMTKGGISGKRPGGPGASPSYMGWKVEGAAKGTPLAVHLAKELLISEEEAADLIDFGSVHLGDRLAQDPGKAVVEGEEIRVYWPWNGTKRVYEIDPARILYQDRHILAYDKEAGIPSQQTPSDAYNNLYAALLRHLGKKKGAREAYAALHHRLDRETSGVIVLSLDRSANKKLGEAFLHHTVVKDYLAWASGNPEEDSWVSREDITRKGGRYCTCRTGQGKSAETRFTVLIREEDRFLVLARPLTGRTHQIRLHLAARGQSILGDVGYGGKPASRLLLHAYRIRLPHPASGAVITLTAPLPPDWPHPHPSAIPD